MDHILPVERYEDTNGKIKMRYPERNVIENMAPSCVPCNRYKSSLDVQRVREILEEFIAMALRNPGVHRMMNRGELQITTRQVTFWFERFSTGANTHNPDSIAQFHIANKHSDFPPLFFDGKALFLIRLGIFLFKSSDHLMAGDESWAGTLFE